MNKFDRVFSKFEQSAAHRAVLDRALDVKSRIDRERRVVEAIVEFPEIVSKDILYEIEDKIREVYELNVMRILPKYDASLWTPDYVPEVMRELNRVGAVSRGFFNEYNFKIDGRKLDISVSFNNGGIELLYSAKTNEIISGIIFGEFGIRFEVELIQEQGYVESPPVISAQLAEMEKIARQQSIEIAASASRRDDAPPEPVEDPTANFEHVSTLNKTPVIDEKKDDEYHVGGKIFDVSAPEFLIGDPFDIVDPTPIRDIAGPQKGLIVLGETFGFETKETRRGDKLILTFAVTDKDSSIYIKLAQPKEQLEPYLSNIKDGMTVAIRGYSKIDSFDGEAILMPTAIAKISQKYRTDTAEEKRVELHCHTQMSSMDAIIDPKTLVKT
ncbi:MAG: hypothetical protein IJF67_18135, partial [Clostridia bacterium]|nr:hypothetical protein [Clostridia bacterium]